MKAHNSYLLLILLLFTLIGAKKLQAFYNPETGRWLSRDPIGEQGGIFLYGMVGNDPVNGIDTLGLAAFTAKWVGNGAVMDEENLWVGTALWPDAPPAAGRVESNVAISWTSLKNCDGQDQTLPETPDLSFIDRFGSDAWNKQKPDGHDDGLFPFGPNGGAGNALYHVLLNTGVGNHNGQFGLCNKGEVQIIWSFTAYSERGNSDGYNAAVPIPDDPTERDPTSDNTGALRNEASHKPWKPTAEKPKQGGNAIQNQTYTITVKWDACGANKGKPQVTKSSSPSMNSGPNRAGR